MKEISIIIMVILERVSVRKINFHNNEILERLILSVERNPPRNR